VSATPTRMAVVAALLLAAAGCGKRGEPVAPERRFPAPPASLGATVEGQSVVVSWTNPAQRVDGSALRDLQVVKLFRREEAPGAAPKPAMLARGRIVGYDEIASIRLDEPAPATVERGAVRFVDRDNLTVGGRYVYVVTAVDSTGRSSPPSPRVVVSYIAAPTPPRDLRAEGGDSQVRLHWEAPGVFIDGRPIDEPLGYLVQRATGQGAWSQITPEPVTITEFTDTGLANDTEYRYRVTAVRETAGGQAQGEPSAAATASPARTWTPAAPTGLVAVTSSGSVRLAWNEVNDPDVAAYAVYRAEGTGELSRIATTPGSTVFVDRGVQPGRSYRYAVSALDRARRPNESARSDEIRVTAE
jgi:fibronectin type 3 domain-containing protein